MKDVSQSLPEVPRLVVDAGNFSWLQSPMNRIKTRYLIQGMNLLKVEVANLGWNELGHEIDYLRQMEQEAQFSFISANIFLSNSSTPLVSPSIIKEFSLRPRGDNPQRELRVGILGLCADTARYNLPSSLFPKADIIPPKKAIAQALDDLRERCHLVILLAALPLEEARQLCREHQGIDIILGAFGVISNSSPLREGNTIIWYGGKDGEMIGELKLFLDEKLMISSYLSQLVPLEPWVGEDQRMKQLMEDANKEVSEFIKKSITSPAKKGT